MRDLTNWEEGRSPTPQTQRLLSQTTHDLNHHARRLRARTGPGVGRPLYTREAPPGMEHTGRARIRAVIEVRRVQAPFPSRTFYTKAAVPPRDKSTEFARRCWATPDPGNFSPLLACWTGT